MDTIETLRAALADIQRRIDAIAPHEMPVVRIGNLEWSHTLCDGERVNYAEAEAACKALGEEWRLATYQELLSLVDVTRHDPCIDIECFPDTKSASYWTATPCAWAPSCAWVVYFGYGDVYGNRRDVSLAFVRAVRAVPAGQ